MRFHRCLELTFSCVVATPTHQCEFALLLRIAKKITALGLKGKKKETNKKNTQKTQQKQKQNKKKKKRKKKQEKKNNNNNKKKLENLGF